VLARHPLYSARLTWVLCTRCGVSEGVHVGFHLLVIVLSLFGISIVCIVVIIINSIIIFILLLCLLFLFML